ATLSLLSSGAGGLTVNSSASQIGSLSGTTVSLGTAGGAPVAVNTNTVTASNAIAGAGTFITLRVAGGNLNAAVPQTTVGFDIEAAGGQLTLPTVTLPGQQVTLLAQTFATGTINVSSSSG